MPSDSSHLVDPSQRFNARLGLVLFFLYLLLYVGFVGISAFAPSWMEWRPMNGMNLALLYGFGLILVALGLAFIYGIFAKSPVDEPTALHPHSTEQA